MNRRGWLALVPALVAGCLFRDAGGPPRFFVPVSTAIGSAADDVPVAGAGEPIRLGVVHGVPFLRERIVWRVSPVESGQYERRLWRELPARYVERSLAVALRRTGGIRPSNDARAAVLDVEVLAFDEVLSPTHAATVTLTASLRDAHGDRSFERTLTADAPIVGNDPATMAQAMGRALDDVTAEVAGWAGAALAAHRYGGSPRRR